MVDVAETLGEGELLLGRDGLVAKEDHEMLEPGGLDLLERFIVQGAEVDPADFSAESAGDGLDFDATVGCHGLTPPLPSPSPRLRGRGSG